MSDELLILHTETMARALGELGADDSLASLRLRLARLRAVLAGAAPDDRGLLAADASAGTTALSRGHLLDQLDQVRDSQTVERARYYLGRLVRALTEVRTNGVNDLNLNRWQEYGDVLTDSLWLVERRDSSGAHSAGYWGNFIPQIPNQMVRRYTRPGEWVLDTFLGCGTTLIETQRLGRHGLGAELQSEIAARARASIAAEPNPHGVVAEVVVGDSASLDYRALLRQHGRESVQLVIAHPPYHDIIRFSADPRDLSNSPSVDAFLGALGRVVDNAAAVLDPGRYFVLVIGDKYAQGEWVPLGFLAMSEALRRGFSLKSIVVKNFDETTAKRRQQDLWRYRALAGGFYVFKHEYVFVLRKVARKG